MPGRSCIVPPLNAAESRKENPPQMSDNLLLEAYVFVLALFVGFQLISRVPPILHTPLMSGTNAIHGIVLLGGLLLMSESSGVLEKFLLVVAIAFGTINVIGGFLVTDRMLEMFKRKDPPKVDGEEGGR